MPIDLEFIDPYDVSAASLFVRAEHLARYLFAAETARRRRLRRVLDCACGDGYGCRVLAKHAAVAGVDRNRALIDRGIEENRAQRLDAVRLVCADVDDGLGLFETSSFDMVACFETLEHVREDGALLGEFHRLLRRGGLLALSVPKAGYEPADEEGRPVNPHHLRHYDEQSLTGLLRRSGFDMEKALGQPYTNAARSAMESYRRDTGAGRDVTDGYFTHTPDALAFYARVFGWPTADHGDASNVLVALARRA